MLKKNTARKKSLKSIKKIDQKREVKKHNYLVEAYYATSKQEQRVFHWAASEVDPKKPDINIFRIPVQELIKLAGVSNRSIYEEIVVVTDRLRSRKIDIRDIEKNKLIQATLVASVEYDKSKHFVEIEISKKVMPYLILLNQYTKFNLGLFFSLNSGYAMRIYELMKQYQNIGVRVIPVDELRKYIGVDDKKSYQRFNNLNYRILKPSFEEINKKMDIWVEYEPIKQGRNVTAIKCVINSKRDVVEAPENQASGELVELLKSYNVHKRKAEKLAKDFPDNIYPAIEALKANQNVKNPAAFLVKAIESSWRDSKADIEREEREKQKKRDAQRKTREIAEKIKKQEQAAYDDYRRSLVQETIKNLPAKKEKGLRESLKQITTNSLFNTKPGLFKNKDVWLNSFLFSDGLNLLAQEENLKVKSFEEFLEEVK